jgi:hypothetical protein
MAMMYFFPSDEFQIRENRFIKIVRAGRTARNLQTGQPHRQQAEEVCAGKNARCG